MALILPFTPQITTRVLSSGVAGTPYSFPLTAASGTPPYTWSMVPTSIDGLTLDPNSGILSGTPTVATTVPGVFTVTDSASLPSPPVSLSFTAAPPAGTGGGPIAMWDGYVDTTSFMINWWPPATQTTWAPLVNVSTWTPGPAFTGATGCTLVDPWPYLSGNYLVVCFQATGQQILQGVNSSTSGTPLGTFTNGSRTVTWTPALQSAPSIALTISVGLQGVQGIPDYYKVYQDGTPITYVSPPLTKPGIVADDVPPRGSVLYNRFFPWTVIKPGDNLPHVYTVSAVTGVTESAVGPPLTMQTVSPGHAQDPAPPTAPSTWIQPFSLPTGNRWTVTQTAQANYNAVGGLGWALSQANINGGDIIIVPAGSQITVPGNGATIPNFTGTNGWTYIISSNDPVLNPSASPALPAYTTTLTNRGWTPISCTAAIPANATTATLSSAWAQKTGWYYVLFTEGTTVEERQTLFTQGSTAITWANLNGLYTTVGLAAVASATIQVAYLPGVTPADIPSMATLLFGQTLAQQGILINQNGLGTSKVRFVGINVQPILGGAKQSSMIAILFGSDQVGSHIPPAESVYFDRCIVGNDTNDPGWMMVTHGISGINCNHFLVHQCYIWGIVNDFTVNTGDTNNLGLGGGPHCWENTYFQCGAESIIYGGAFLSPPPDTPHDIVVRYNMSHKPRVWIQGMANPPVAGTAWYKFGRTIKDHFELKGGIRAEYVGNHVLNAWWGTIQNYRAAAFSMTARDQQWGALLTTNITQSCPWSRITDVWIHDNQCDYVGGLFYTLTGDPQPPTYIARLKVTNNRVLVSTLLPGAPLQQRTVVITLSGPCTDLIIDHNTFIANTVQANGGFAIQAISTIGGGTGPGTYATPSPFSPNAMSPYQDRVTITNNIFDSGPGNNTAIATLAPGVAFSAYPAGNTLIANNMTISDGATYSATGAGTLYLPGTFNHPAGVGVYTVGFANFRGNTLPPLNPSDWNITTGTFATASTTGGPLGATF